MKHIFVGGSTESLDQAEKVAAILEEVSGVKARLWNDCFGVGDLTFLAIENIASQVSGAVFLATPDDDSVIRGVPVKTARSNVLFEYGYLTALLTRSRVALCRYSGTELPSDFAGLTYIPMGEFRKQKSVENHSRVKLKSWASELPTVQEGFASTSQVHGYSGKWQVETLFNVWRTIKLDSSDRVLFRGDMILHVPTNGEGVTGCVIGELQMTLKDCSAEFEVTDRVVDGHVGPDGSLHLRCAMQTRHRKKLKGKPPQKEGFERELCGIRDSNVTLSCSEGTKGVMKGQYRAFLGDVVYSEATEKYFRLLA